MRGIMIIVGFVFAWTSLYQGIVAFGAPAVRDDELTIVRGLVRHVDTPLMRNRLVDQAVLEIETAPARLVELAIPTAYLSLERVQALVGQDISVTVASRRPRNRWIYALTTTSDGQELVRLADSRGYDAALRRANLFWMVGCGAIAALLFALALRQRDRSSGV